MTDEKILSQDEIDALIHGIDAGAVDTEPAAAPGEVRGFDFRNQVRIVRGRLPTLDMINERFARRFRLGLYNLLRRAPEIGVSPVQMKKFAEYVHTLHVPTSLNLVKINPLRGTALVVLCLLYTSDAADDTPCVDLGAGPHARSADLRSHQGQRPGDPQ